MKVHPYLNFDGKAEEAFEFYRTVFGGEFKSKMKMNEMPEGDKLPKEEQERIMHISMPLGEDTMLMASDTVTSAGQQLKSGSQTYVLLDTESREEASRIFKELSQGGEMEMQIADTFWGAYFGSFIDKFGIRWMVNYDKNQS